MENPALKRRIVAGLVFTLLIAAASFFIEQAVKDHGRKRGALLAVVQDGTALAHLDASTIAQLGDQEQSLPAGANRPQNGGRPERKGYCSMDFILESAGVETYRQILAYSTQDNETIRLSRNEVSGMALCPDADGTLAMLKKSDQTPVMKKVSTLNVIR